MRLVFQHIPKTAGTTIRYYFKAAAGANFYTDGMPFGSQYLVYASHFTTEGLKDIPGPRCVFTFLRDPVDRVISLYRFWLLRIGGPDYQMRAREMSFEDFISLDDENIRTQFENGMTKQLGGKEALENMVFVGFQETFEQDMERFRRLFFLPSPTEWPRANENDEITERFDRHDVPPVEWFEPYRDRLEEMNKLDRELYDWARKQF